MNQLSWIFNEKWHNVVASRGLIKKHSKQGNCISTRFYHTVMKKVLMTQFRTIKLWERIPFQIGDSPSSFLFYFLLSVSVAF